jgi:hypothetical protein
MSNGYARFECRICGELVYSSIALEHAAGIPAEISNERLVELTCSHGHTDQYTAHEIKRAGTKPVGVAKGNIAKAAFG